MERDKRKCKEEKSQRLRNEDMNKVSVNENEQHNKKNQKIKNFGGQLISSFLAN